MSKPRKPRSKAEAVKGMRKLEDYRDHEKGRTVAVIGNGPSLLQVDPDRLNVWSDVWIGLNRSWRWDPKVARKVGVEFPTEEPDDEEDDEP